MDSLQPLINFLVVLTALSIVAERITNHLKQRTEELGDRKEDVKEERKRVQAIHNRGLIVGVLVSIALKADFFSMIAHLDDPWKTLGWVRVEGAQWVQSTAIGSSGTFLYAIAGCFVTGLALGFGSKFWHDVLGSLYEIRALKRSNREQRPTR